MTRKRRRVAPALSVAASESTPAAELLRSSLSPLWTSLWALVIGAATILAYQQAWSAGYIWDDDKYVTQNPLLTAPDGLKRIWFSLDSPSQYFPLVYTTFRIEHAIWGLHPAGYHWVNILLHVANALLVWRVLHLLRVPGAWLAAAMFALHPVHVESVAWITERKNVLMGLFFLLALLAWMRFTVEETGRRWSFYLAALVCYALALFSKTTACTLPAALLLVPWLKHRAITWSRAVQVAPFVLLGLAMGLLTIWWERNVQGTQGEIFAIGLPERVLVVGRACWFYLWKLIWPARLVFSYPRWSISVADPLAYVWPTALVALAAAIYFARSRVGRGPEVAALFFAATLSPVLGFVMLYTFRYSFVADHYQYLASIGPLALASAFGVLAAGYVRARNRFVAPVFGAVVLLALAARTWTQAGIYANEETLWRATVASSPASWMAHNNLAIELVKHERTAEAVPYYEQALRLNPQYAEGRFNLANAFVRLGRDAEAPEHYRRAVELFPRFAAAHVNLGIVLARAGQLEEAAQHLRSAIDIQPSDAVAQANLGTTLSRMGRLDEAVGYLRSAITQNPADATMRNDLGDALAQLGQTQEAALQLRQASELEPTNAQAHFSLANLLIEQRRPDEAIAEYAKALELRPSYAAAHINLANTLAQLGRVDEAIAHYEQALEIRPDYAAAHHNLGRLLLRNGRSAEGERHLQVAAELGR